MIDTDDLDNMSRRDLVELLEAYNESLAEVKRLRNALNNEREVVQAFYDYREAQTLSGYNAINQWMIDNGHRVLLLENEDDPTSAFCEWLYDVCDYPWKMDESGYYLGEDGVWREVESEEE